MPPSRSWRSARSSSITFMLVLLVSVVNEVAIHGELSNERIDLPQGQPQLRSALQVAAHEAVFRDADFQSRCAGVIDGSHAVFLGQREYAQDTAHSCLPVKLIHGLAERADLSSCSLGSLEKLLRAQRSALGAILVENAMAASWLG